MADETHETKIVVPGDASGASKALSLVGEKINGVLKAVGNVTKFLSRLNWAVTAVTTLVGVVQKLHDTLSKQQSVQSIQDQGRKDYEDGKREADRARQIYEAKTPEEEQRLRDKFAAEDERREREDRKEQRKRQIENLDREELEQRFKANAETASGYEKEAKFRRDKIAALENQRDYDGPTAGEWQRKTEAKKREEEAQADRISAADGVSSNRLTAMGLGSGVKGNANIASDVKKMVKLLEEQIAATKDIDLTSTFGE